MAKRYKKVNTTKRKQVVLASVALVVFTIVIAGVIVKANQGLFKSVFNNNNYTIISSVVSSNENSITSSEVPSSYFSSKIIDVLNSSSSNFSSDILSSKSTSEPTKSPTPTPTPMPTPTPNPTNSPVPTPVPTPNIQNLTIMGINNSEITAQKMVDFISSKSPVLNCTPLELVNLYLSIGEKYGVRGDIAFCQAIKETNWFRFTGDVKSDQNNFCGLGATGNGAEGEHFFSPQIGVRAHIQHLFAYATKDNIPQGETIVDPRFSLVNRGSAIKWTGLAGKWAVPGYDITLYTSFEQAFYNNATYGQLILQKYSDLLK